MAFKTLQQVAVMASVQDADIFATARGSGALSSATGTVLSTYFATKFPPLARQVATSGLLTGGGDLSADRTFNLTAASSADVTAGTSTTAAVTPASLAGLNLRQVLSGDRTWFVRTDGNDSNTGSANDAAHAFLTVQHAINVITAVDLNGFTATIQIADGTYAGAVLLNGPLYGQRQPGNLLISGNVVTPANVVFSYAGVNGTVGVNNAGMLAVRGVKFTGGVSTYGLAADRNGLVEFQTCDFGATSQHLYARGGGRISATGNYTISGAANAHLRSESQGLVRTTGVSVTLTGTPAFAVAFAYAPFGGVIEADGMTFTGSATGPRFNASLNSVISTLGGGASYLPGNSVGVSATGGQYA